MTTGLVNTHIDRSIANPGENSKKNMGGGGLGSGGGGSGWGVGQGGWEQRSEAYLKIQKKNFLGGRGGGGGGGGGVRVGGGGGSGWM